MKTKHGFYPGKISSLLVLGIFAVVAIGVATVTSFLTSSQDIRQRAATTPYCTTEGNWCGPGSNPCCDGLSCNSDSQTCRPPTPTTTCSSGSQSKTACEQRGDPCRQRSDGCWEPIPSATAVPSKVPTQPQGKTALASCSEPCFNTSGCTCPSNCNSSSVSNYSGNCGGVKAAATAKPTATPGSGGNTRCQTNRDCNVGYYCNTNTERCTLASTKTALSSCSEPCFNSAGCTCPSNCNSSSVSNYAGNCGGTKVSSTATPRPTTTPASQCYFGVSSCSSVNRYPASGACSCPNGAGVCCGDSIPTAAKVCSPGTSVCANNVVRVCDSYGTGWTDTACAAGTSCVGNRCEAPLNSGQSCSQPHGQLIRDNKYCCDFKIKDGACVAPIDTHDSTPLADGTWCYWTAFGTGSCANCSSGTTHKENGKDICGPDITSLIVSINGGEKCTSGSGCFCPSTNRNIRFNDSCPKAPPAPGTENTCQAGQTQCVDSMMLQSCGPNNTWAETQQCPANQVCQNGGCVVPPSPPNAGEVIVEAIVGLDPNYWNQVNIQQRCGNFLGIQGIGDPLCNYLLSNAQLNAEGNNDFLPRFGAAAPLGISIVAPFAAPIGPAAGTAAYVYGGATIGGIGTAVSQIPAVQNIFQSPWVQGVVQSPTMARIVGGAFGAADAYGYAYTGVPPSMLLSPSIRWGIDDISGAPCILGVSTDEEAKNYDGLGQVLGCIDRYGIGGAAGEYFDDLASRTAPTNLDPDFYNPPAALQSTTLSLAQDMVSNSGKTTDQMLAVIRSLPSNEYTQSAIQGLEALERYEEARLYALAIAQSGQQLTVRELTVINSLVEGTTVPALRAGAVKTVINDQVWRYPAPQVVEQATSEALEFVNIALEQGVAPSQIAPAVRELIVRVHPFPNGNGRTAQIVEEYVSNIITY